MSRKSQVVGSNWESWIETQFDKGLRLGILAHWVHNQAKTNVVRGRLIYTAKGCADYTCVLSNGMTLAAEAKSVGEDYLPHSMIESKQVEHLDAVSRAGGTAFLLAEFRHGILPRDPVGTGSVGDRAYCEEHPHGRDRGVVHPA